MERPPILYTLSTFGITPKGYTYLFHLRWIGRLAPTFPPKVDRYGGQCVKKVERLLPLVFPYGDNHSFVHLPTKGWEAKAKLPLRAKPLA